MEFTISDGLSTVEYFVYRAVLYVQHAAKSAIGVIEPFLSLFVCKPSLILI